MSPSSRHVVQSGRRVQRETSLVRDRQRRLEVTLESAFEGIAQLGMMASVLSRSASIEAASGTERQQQQLTIASLEFARYAENVNRAIAAMIARDKDVRR